MNQDIQSLQTPPCAGPYNECDQVIYEVLTELAALAEKARRLGLSLPAIPTSVAQIDDGLTDAMRAVLQVVEQHWPDGKPTGKRSMHWYCEIEEACKAAKVEAKDRTIRSALNRQKLAANACQNLPKLASFSVKEGYK